MSQKYYDQKKTIWCTVNLMKNLHYLIFAMTIIKNEEFYWVIRKICHVVLRYYFNFYQSEKNRV